MDFYRLAIRLSAAIAVSIAVSCQAPSAQAHRRDFPSTYDWYQPSKGEKEFESHTLYRPGDRTLQEQVEYEYGVSKRFMVAPYLVFERGTGEHLAYSAFKVESRYQLGKYRTNRFLPGLYLEYEKPRAATGEVEAKLILSRYDKRGGDFSLNLIAEHSLRSGAELRKTFSLGYARPLGKSKVDWRGGVELVRNIDDGRLNLGPVLGRRVGEHIAVLGSCGFPINKPSINGGEARLLAEYEWD